MKVRLRPHPPRPAFTLIELLVVLAILAVLVGLLLPAVQRVRDASLRVRCGNNLHQIGLAAVSYHDVQNSFPPGSCSPLGPNRTYSLAGWLTLLLPYVEQENLWAQTVAAYRQSSSPFRNPPHVGPATVLPAFACPADPRAAQVQFAPRDRFWVALTCYTWASRGRTCTAATAFCSSIPAPALPT
jgi:prepilin-type N-terminal cleavage/methylation domain-containing protein